MSQFPIVERQGDDLIFRFKQSADGLPDETQITNIKDACRSYLEERKIKEILKIVYDLDPCYLNEVFDVYGKMDRATLTRFLARLVNRGFLIYVGMDDEDVQKKLGKSKPTGSPASKFYRVVPDKIIQTIQGENISIKDFLESGVPEDILKRIDRRKEYIWQIQRDLALDSLPPHERVIKAIRDSLAASSSDDGVGERFTSELAKYHWYATLGKWPCKNNLELLKRVLKQRGFVQEIEGVPFLVDPDRLCSDNDETNISNQELCSDNDETNISNQELCSDNDETNISNQELCSDND